MDDGYLEPAPADLDRDRQEAIRRARDHYVAGEAGDGALLLLEAGWTAEAQVLATLATYRELRRIRRAAESR